MVPYFLEAVYERVKRDAKSPGFSGRVAIGVKQCGNCATWLVLACGRECRVEWSQDQPKYDAAIGLDEAAAAAVLAGHSPPAGSLYMTTGDSELLARFLTHYFGDTASFSALGLRAHLSGA